MENFFYLLLLKTEINYSSTKYKQNASPSEFLVEQRVQSNEQLTKSNKE